MPAARSALRVLMPPLLGDSLAAALAGAECPVLDGAVDERCSAVLLDQRWPPPRTLFAAVLATRTAYDGALVPSVVGWAVHHGHLPADRRCEAETALCEALANALIHGNLELPGLDAYGGDVNAFLADISVRLADDSYGLRPVGLMWRRTRRLLLLHVDDAGHGYKRSSLRRSAAAVPASGRGWALMTAFARRVRVSRDGRRTTLGFLHV
ncbi:ATP-binding protein [Azospirillum sp. sgz301742]